MQMNDLGYFGEVKAEVRLLHNIVTYRSLLDGVMWSY